MLASGSVVGSVVGLVLSEYLQYFSFLSPFYCILLTQPSLQTSVSQLEPSD
jgi:hypothetical protein